jgi:hypothetical protein
VAIVLNKFSDEGVLELTPARIKWKGENYCCPSEGSQLRSVIPGGKRNQEQTVFCRLLGWEETNREFIAFSVVTSSLSQSIAKTDGNLVSFHYTEGIYLPASKALPI